MQHTIIVEGYDYDLYNISIAYFDSTSGNDMCDYLEITVDELDEYLTEKGFIDVDSRDDDGEPMTVYSFLNVKSFHDYSEIEAILADYIFIKHKL